MSREWDIRRREKKLYDDGKGKDECLDFYVVNVCVIYFPFFLTGTFFEFI